MKFKEWINFNENTKLCDLVESTSNTRYSVDVNFRSQIDEVMKQYAKIALGYVSAALKQNNYHIKHVYDQDPVRIIVSTRYWDDGEWVLLITFSPKDRSFLLSKGFYNKDRGTVSVQSSKRASGDSAAAVTSDARNMLHALKSEPDRHQEKLKGINMKRGPKK